MVICSCGTPSPFFGIPTAATVPHSIGRWKRWKHYAIGYRMHSVERHRTNFDVAMVIPTYPKHTYHISLSEGQVGRENQPSNKHYKVGRVKVLWIFLTIIPPCSWHAASKMELLVHSKLQLFFKVHDGT